MIGAGIITTATAIMAADPTAIMAAHPTAILDGEEAGDAGSDVIEASIEGSVTAAEDTGASF